MMNTLWKKLGPFATASLACIAVTALMRPIHDVLDQANVVMCYLLVVFLAALRLGRGPATWAALLSVALFDFFFVLPYFSFAVADAQYLLTFAVMLVVALVTTHLTARIQEQAETALGREQESRRLYQLALDLAQLAEGSRLDQALQTYLQGSPLEAQVHLLDAHEHFPSLSRYNMTERLAHLAVMQGRILEDADFLIGDKPTLVLPIRGSERGWGVLLVSCPDKERLEAEQDRLATVASVIGLTVERLHYAHKSQRHELQIQAEQLRSSLLSALSHDLRTPLTALVGLAEQLCSSKEPLPDPARLQAQQVREQAQGLHHLMSNVLDMARLQAGGLTLRKEWQLFEDVVGASIKLMRGALSQHKLDVSMAPDLPLVEFDAVLLERALCNLLDNAAKFAPAASVIQIRAWVTPQEACLAVLDQGPGIPEGQQERLMALFERGVHESALPGVGLGLSITRSIISAHSGQLSLENRPDGGTQATLHLPLGTPPSISQE